VRLPKSLLKANVVETHYSFSSDVPYEELVLEQVMIFQDHPIERFFFFC
jgi:hypothetical protein